MPQTRLIAENPDLVGECPVWNAETGCLYWTDCIGKRFYRYQYREGRSQLVKEGLEIFSFVVNRPRGFLVCNTEGIWGWDGANGLRLIVSEVQGIKCKMNDSVADPKGRLIGGTNFYDPEGGYKLGHLIRVEVDGAATILDEGIHLSNGLAFSPDCATLYYADSAARCIYAYDYLVARGDLSNRRVFARIASDEGIPDGLAVDADGFVWSAQWYGNCVLRFDSEGDYQMKIATPAKQTSSITFGGDDLTDIFITSASLPFVSPLMPSGYDPFSANVGGQLFHVNLGIKGLPTFTTALDL